MRFYDQYLFSFVKPAPEVLIIFAGDADEAPWWVVGDLWRR